MITVTSLAGPNAVISGLFFDPPSAPPPPATRLPGQDGHRDAGQLDRHLRLAGLQHHRRPRQPTPPTPPSRLAGQSTYTWAASTTDRRALQNPGGSGRIAAVLVLPTSFSVDVNLTDGQTHDLALYAVDWDNRGGASRSRSPTPPPGPCWTPRRSRRSPAEPTWTGRSAGNVVITVTMLGGPNAVLSGLFFDPQPVELLHRDRHVPAKTDTTTQGNWIGTYGVAGLRHRRRRRQPPRLRHRHALRPVDLYLGRQHHRPARPPEPPAAPAASPPAGTRHQLHRRRQPDRRPDPRPGPLRARLGQPGPERADPDQRRRHRDGAGHRDDLVVLRRESTWTGRSAGNVVITITKLAGANAVLSGLFLDPATIRDDGQRSSSGHDDAGELDRHLRRAGLRHHRRHAPASPPTPRSRPPASRPTPGPPARPTPAPCRTAGGSGRIAACWYAPPASPSTST